jgi:hypothetical protein
VVAARERLTQLEIRVLSFGVDPGDGQSGAVLVERINRTRWT